METAKERVQKELDDLNGKIVKLTMFMTSPAHEKMNEAEKYLLLKQLDAMVDYARALQSRLAIWREIE
nr:MAG TPA: hypothetical protein [Bacteriophage sp.]